MPSKRCKNGIIAFVIAIIGGILLFPEFFNVHLKCPFAFITGIPCPGCGMTRAVRSLLNGDIIQSLFHNPLAIPTIIAIVITITFLIIDIIHGTNRVEILMSKKWGKVILIPVAILILATWIFNLYKHFALNY